MKKLNFKIKVRHFEKMIQENSPLILTALGVAGTIGTAVLVGKASWKAAQTIEDAEFHVQQGDVLPTTKDKALLVWKLYLPAVGVGSATIACIVMSHRISARRLAAMTGAFALLAKDREEYRDKVLETVGLKKAGEIDEKVAASQIASYGAPGGLLDPAKSWFLDMASKRYIATTTETLKGAQNEINFTILNHGDASLTDFYAQIGMDPTSVSDKLGWNRQNKCELKVTTILTEDRGAVACFEFIKGPVPNHWKSGPVDPDEISGLGA